ncbi:MAG TPA: amino acid adenylation domain-containing protein, partial [Allosphingosinicella sp.]
MNKVQSRDVATESPVSYPETSLSELLLHNSRNLGGTVAVESGAASLTYAELGEAVRRAAFGLVQAGCVPGSTVAIYMPRSIDQIVAILAVHHLGAAYLPINPAHALLRNQRILDDSRAPILLHAAGGSEPPAGAATVSICFETLVDSVRDSVRDPCPHDPPAPAYILYTSGSTGEPKGAVLPRGALSNHTLWFNDEFGIGPGDRLLQRTSCTFDASVYEIFCSLTAGATLVLSPVQSDEDVLACADAFETLDITRFPCVPSLLDVFLEAGLIARMPRLRTVFLGGEKLTVELVRRLASQTSAECVNLYGPTETTIDTTFVRVAGFSGEIPIGKPIANVEVHVVDEDLREVPDGQEGELLISGAGLGLGYLNRPELTAKSFISVPPELGGRAYRTGDRGRRGEDGFLYFRGRLDGQIKIRGQRIEMGEIEGVLRSLPLVTAAAVIPKKVGEGLYELHAFVTGPSAGSAGGLRSAMEERLTSAMVPHDIHIMPSLPLTSSGKIDRQALARAAEAFEPGSDFARSSPAESDLDPLERDLAAIWSELLGGREVTGQSHFFECGGHSLLAARMILMIRHRFNVVLSTRALYENPTLRALAAYVRTVPSAKAADLSTRSQSGAVSFGQQQMWLLETVARKPAIIAVAYELHGPIDRSALEDSLAELVTRHSALRLSFELTKPDYRLTQAVGDPPAGSSSGLLSVRNAPWTNVAERKATLEACARERVDAAGPFLIAATLFSETPLKSVFLITMNHLCGDGWSTNLLLRDLSIIYNARLAGEPPVLAPTSSYVAWAELERAFYSSDDGIAAVNDWATRLRGLPTHLELPRQAAGGAPAGLARPFATFEVRSHRKSRLEEVASSFNITPFTFYLAAFEALISELYEAEEFIVTVNFANRVSPESAETVGMY